MPAIKPDTVQMTPKLLMKAAIVPCLCMLVLSCRHQPQGPQPPRQVYPAISSALGMLQGSWISHDYKVSLTKTHSPYRSSSYIDGVFSFMIDSNDASHDTIYFTGLIKGESNNSLWIALGHRDSTGSYTAGQKVYMNNDPTTSDNIIRARIDSGRVVLYTAESDSMRYDLYDHVSKARPADYMLKRYTTAALFDGGYTTRDTTTIFMTSYIAFDTEHMGRMTGSPSYDSFDINIDILAQHDTMNYMELYDTRGGTESHSYTYQFIKNKLIICPLSIDAPCCRLLRSDSIIH